MSTTPRISPISSPPGQEDQSARLAASAEVGQVEGTIQDFRDHLLNQRESLSLISAMEEKVLAIECALHELDLYVGKPRISVLEQFQRWLETKAHAASACVDGSSAYPTAAELGHLYVIAECRAATKLLMQFKLEQGQ